jgi:predicted esterase
VGCLTLVVLGAPALAEAKEAPAWCGPGFDALPGDVCHIDGRKSKDSARRTLVIWLHGVIALNTDWSQQHQKMLARVAKYNEVEVIFPKGLPSDGNVYAWPGTRDSQEKNEQALIDQWMAAKKVLEDREHKTFDEVYVFGFSSGAYFASSLAMRGRLAVDGYATFCGGQPMPASASPVEKFSPTFVGVCADDKTTASHSRAFAGSLAAAGIPRMVSEQHVGHGVSEVHFAQAISFLHGKAKPSVALRAEESKPSG